VSGSEWRSRLRWVVVHPNGPEVLLLGGSALPEAELSGEVWTADAEVTTTALRELVGVDGVLLSVLEEREDPAARVQRATLVATPPDRAAAPPPGASWVGRADLDALAGGGNEHAAVAARALDEPAGGPPWADPGWFHTAAGWLRASLERLGTQATGPVRQLRVWELSCILTAPTARGDVYLKAVPDAPPFANEGAVMRSLAELFPDHVPVPLAVDAGRRWTVLADFGEELGDDEHGWDVPVEVREDVVRTFARLQVRAAPHADRLLAAGLPDRGLGWLAEQARGWLPEVEATGRLPAIDAATWLLAEEAAELRAAVPRLAAMCGELAGHAVPPSVVHGDLHLANVAKGPHGHVFFDWTDACVAHPFVDLLTMFQAGEELEVEGPVRDRLRDAYLAEWAGFEPAGRLLRAWRLAEPLGALHHAVGYRSLAEHLRGPVDRHMAASTAWWLRKVLAELRSVT
jgi:Phosphotransferase enzyme family